MGLGNMVGMEEIPSYAVLTGSTREVEGEISGGELEGKVPGRDGDISVGELAGKTPELEGEVPGRDGDGSIEELGSVASRELVGVGGGMDDVGIFAMGVLVRLRDAELKGAGE